MALFRYEPCKTGVRSGIKPIFLLCFCRVKVLLSKNYGLQTGRTAKAQKRYAILMFGPPPAQNSISA